MSDSGRARARSERFSRLSFSVHARNDVPGMSAAVEKAKQLARDPRNRKALKEANKRGSALAMAQELNGPSLYVDKYLRNFLREYNGRIFEGQGMYMPNSYNVMHAFLEPDEKAMVLRLLPEQFNAISFTRLLDHITDPQANLNLKALADRIDDLQVYEINMLGGYAEFKIPGAEEFVFCGVGFCREANELSIVGIFGRSNPAPQTAVIPADKNNLFPGKDFLLEGKETIDVSDEALFGDAGFLPIILMARVDTERDKVQVRYVFQEKRDTFDVVSDDPQVLAYLAEHKQATPGLIESVLSRLEEFEPLFELLLASPCCLDLMEDDAVALERHPTGLRVKSNSREARMTRILLQSEAPKYVHVRTLYDLGEGSPAYELPPVGLTIETAGYWKTLPLGSQGKDRNGLPIQGKTWVTTQTSWFEATSNRAPSVGTRIDTPNLAAEEVGHLYVMRNASHPRDVFKIGFTTKAVEERARQLGATSGQPDIFNVVESWRIRSPRLIEYEVHELLKDHRVNTGREFFCQKYEKIREVIERVVEKANAAIDDDDLGLP